MDLNPPIGGPLLCQLWQVKIYRILPHVEKSWLLLESGLYVALATVGLIFQFIAGSGKNCRPLGSIFNKNVKTCDLRSIYDQHKFMAS